MSKHSARLVPAAIRLAAKRAFVRTTLQGYAATIPAGGLTSAAILAVVQNPDPLVLGTTVAAAVLTPPLAGLASWLDITYKGIPSDYQAEHHEDPVKDLKF